MDWLEGLQSMFNDANIIKHVKITKKSMSNPGINSFYRARAEFDGLNRTIGIAA